MKWENKDRRKKAIAAQVTNKLGRVTFLGMSLLTLDVTMEISFKLFFNAVECGSHMDILKWEIDGVRNTGRAGLLAISFRTLVFFDEEEDTT